MVTFMLIYLIFIFSLLRTTLYSKNQTPGLIIGATAVEQKGLYILVPLIPLSYCFLNKEPHILFWIEPTNYITGPDANDKRSKGMGGICCLCLLAFIYSSVNSLWFSGHISPQSMCLRWSWFQIWLQGCMWDSAGSIRIFHFPGPTDWFGDPYKS